ncbi:MAG: N-acetylmuramoyl-L-alanine amidase [Oscillospiraceae bacterium]|nr:N-acetylmuramoyl-L-alanine amidase [Oscillospiraceae bacterium]
MEKKIWFRQLIPVYALLITVCIVLVYFTGAAVTAWSENRPLSNRKCVIIDAGHGGVDGGATSCAGILESHYNLDIALRLNDLLHLLGIDTVMIRTEDVSVYTSGNTIAQKKISDLKERVRIVNNSEDAILVSIHQNYFSDGRYSGAQVFYGPTDGSQILARQLQNAFKAYLDSAENRQIKKADGIYLMQNIKKIGVLVECGFLSNVKEEGLLRSPAYQKKISCVMAVVLSTYLHGKYAVD